MTLPDSVKAFMLLSVCNLSDSERQLIMSAVTEVSYERMRSALCRIFAGEADIASATVKSEPVFVAEDGDSRNIVELVSLEDGGRETALKLHKQFGHLTTAKLLKLVRDAGVNNVDLEQAIKKLSENCEICCKFKRARPRPVVCLPMASKFNETVAMDLKKFLTDNEREFNNAEMWALGEAFNIKVMATAAESPWSNGVCERQNAVIGDIVRKVLADTHDLQVALAWTISARNVLMNDSGYCPNQLVFGYNPVLPNVWVNDPPALTASPPSGIVRDKLNALHIARQEFPRKESTRVPEVVSVIRNSVAEVDQGTAIEESSQAVLGYPPDDESEDGDTVVMQPEVATGSDARVQKVKIDVLKAKDSEIANWRNNDAYEEIDDVGQETISVR
ncbi:hypothetical protein Pcinc_023829 [Petrolisthes cinctipes]|uniref:Integrase catalytic domain-containing protein n=1 Tax=Petrolisthes cinctipes TaxID=88211 RepID=A0AAE1KBM9_PETCI|nr:hypothetical protein Pcinc_023829 [Petrolisthes cinctipes]